MRKHARWLMAVISIAGAVCSGSAEEKPKPSNRVDWFVEARFGMFIHWGLYSILGGTWNGHTLPDESLKNGKSWYAEWAQMRLEVSRDDYRALVKQFDPVKFDADEWISEAKNAGMRYFVITAKHHDGFALWNSDVSDYDLGATPYKKDILGELAAACKKHDVKLGFYYSHWQDWEYEGGALPHWYRKQPSSNQFEKYWREKSLPQVTELLRRYDPALLWFDTWRDESAPHITPKRRDELIALVRKERPNCLINGRICYHNPGPDIDFLETGDNRHPAKALGRPWQTPATMCHSWGWHADDFHWKSSRKMVSLLAHNAALGGNYLLNIGPKPDGSFPLPAIRRLREIGGWTAANGEAIYGAIPVTKSPVPWLKYTRRVLADGTHRLYVHVLRKPKTGRLRVPVPTVPVIACRVLESAKPIRFKPAGDDGTMLHYDAGDEPSVPVIYLDVKELPEKFRE